jgi:hypothetical protein
MPISTEELIKPSESIEVEVGKEEDNDYKTVSEHNDNSNEE